MSVSSRFRGFEAAPARAENEARRECCSKRLGCKVERLLGAGYPAPEEGEHRGEMPLVEDAERLSARTRFDEKLRIRAPRLALHAFLYDDSSGFVTVPTTFDRWVGNRGHQPLPSRPECAGRPLVGGLLHTAVDSMGGDVVARAGAPRPSSPPSAIRRRRAQLQHDVLVRRR